MTAIVFEILAVFQQLEGWNHFVGKLIEILVVGEKLVLMLLDSCLPLIMVFNTINIFF